jgi:protein phosphatase 1 regulatory subunit 7
VIDISSNKIEHLEGLENNKKLTELWASNNKLSSFAEVEQQLGKKWINPETGEEEYEKKELTTVYFEGNPLQREAGANYVNKVRLALPLIKQIDATMVRY